MAGSLSTSESNMTTTENKLTVLVDSAHKLTVIPDERGLHITLEEMGHDWCKTISCRLSKEQTESLAEQMDRLEQFLGKSTQRSQPGNFVPIAA